MISNCLYLFFYAFVTISFATVNQSLTDDQLINSPYLSLSPEAFEKVVQEGFDAYHSFNDDYQFDQNNQQNEKAKNKTFQDARSKPKKYGIQRKKYDGKKRHEQRMQNLRAKGDGGIESYLEKRREQYKKRKEKVISKGEEAILKERKKIREARKLRRMSKTSKELAIYREKEALRMRDARERKLQGSNLIGSSKTAMHSG